MNFPQVMHSVLLPTTQYCLPHCHFSSQETVEQWDTQSTHFFIPHKIPGVAGNVCDKPVL